MTVEMINRPGGGTGKPLPVDTHVPISREDARAEALRRITAYCRFQAMHVYESKAIHVDDAPIMAAEYEEWAAQFELGMMTAELLSG